MAHVWKLRPALLLMFDSDSRWAWTFLRLPELFADLRLLKAHQSQPSQKLRSLRRAILSTKANLPPGFYWVLVLSEFSGPVWLWLPPTARVEELKAFQLLVDISSLATLAPAQVLWTLEPENLDGVDQKHVLPSRPNPRHQGQELQSDFIFLRHKLLNSLNARFVHLNHVRMRSCHSWRRSECSQ